MTMVRRTSWGVIAAVATAAASAGAVLADGQQCLEGLAREVARDHPRVGTMIPEEFERRLGQREQPLVFDVRERAEFEVSHIPGAVHVDPDISVEDFMARYGELLDGRAVLMYCSVGVRSSILAARISREAMTRGAAGVYNLRGGVFAWHNTGRTLKHAPSRSATWKVHPYSRSWSRFLDFDNYVSYGPRKGLW